jgi:predicted lactoylglutathione lyase
MARTITVSLPVADLKKSVDFYTAMGFVNNAQYSNEGSAFMIISESISVMLLTHATWSSFTTRPIAPNNSSEVGLNISCETREEVDAMNKAAAVHGGVSDINPVEDYEFMYGRDFIDPDGHVWGAKWMDWSKMPANV